MSDRIAISIAVLILAFVVAIPLYLLGAFATLDWNPAVWGPVVRFCIGAIWLFFFVAIICVAAALD